MHGYGTSENTHELRRMMQKSVKMKPFMLEADQMIAHNANSNLYMTEGTLLMTNIGHKSKYGNLNTENTDFLRQSEVNDRLKFRF